MNLQAAGAGSVFMYSHSSWTRSHEGSWAHVWRGLARIVPSSLTMPTPTLLAEPSIPKISMSLILNQQSHSIFWLGESPLLFGLDQALSKRDTALPTSPQSKESGSVADFQNVPPKF